VIKSDNKKKRASFFDLVLRWIKSKGILIKI